MPQVTVRVYGPLNDFLPPRRRQIAWQQVVDGRPSVKDFVESLGVPHPEIDLILVNGTSVGFDQGVHDGDRVAVFPRFVALDVQGLTRVRPPRPEEVRLVADVHLGKLARRLRLAGLDTAYRNDADDRALVDLAARDGRILLTRDAGLLKRRAVVYGCFIRETDPQRQLVEVLRRLGPLRLKPFSRCLRCNGLLHSVSKGSVDAALPPRTRQHYDEFEVCDGCGRIYWKGSHWKRLERLIASAQEEVGSCHEPRHHDS